MSYVTCSMRVPVTVSAGETYYYRFTIGTGSSRPGSCGGVGCLKYGWELTRVSDSDAAQDIARCHYQAPKSIDEDR